MRTSEQIKAETKEKFIFFLPFFESAEQNTQVLENLWQLKEIKVQFHIDNFGTGYSSLSYLHNFPLNVLKINRSFINQIVTSSKRTEFYFSYRKILFNF
ncbi:EAL domain-containing protein [Nostoc sp. UHCC 0302]|uniref:EAL domain-containing protein n=1 Tax=Nostoc sp. UHCC 0302 TaxID=3134896 RepID=UPI00311C90F1